MKASNAEIEAETMAGAVANGASNSEAPDVSKQKEPRVVFTLRVYARPAMSRSIESTQIREALQQCIREFGGGVGNKLKGELFGPADPFQCDPLQDRPAFGSWTYEPSAPP